MEHNSCRPPAHERGAWQNARVDGYRGALTVPVACCRQHRIAATVGRVQQYSLRSHFVLPLLCLTASLGELPKRCAYSASMAASPPSPSAAARALSAGAMKCCRRSMTAKRSLRPLLARRSTAGRSARRAAAADSCACCSSADDCAADDDAMTSCSRSCEYRSRSSNTKGNVRCSRRDRATAALLTSSPYPSPSTPSSPGAARASGADAVPLSAPTMS